MLNQYIDHTALKANTTKWEINKLIDEAIEYNFASVCVNPTWVSLAATRLQDSSVKTCSVIGFPLGANTTASKVFETTNAIENGAEEIDMVINIGALKDGNFDYVKDEIKAVKQACGNIILKVIVETCLLNESEKIKVCEIVLAAGADFIKTSTGFNSGGATVSDIKLFKTHVANNCQIKASGGIRSYADAIEMIESGADRIGTSGGVSIVKGNVNTGDY